MIRALVLLLLLAAPLAAPVAAQDLPAQYAVQGVAADDVLNIRAEPSASADILGSLGPFALNVEVLELSSDGGWGRVGLPEGAGWVSMRYLARQPVPAGELPRPLTCLGTEPFWSLAFPARGGAEFSEPGAERRDLSGIDTAVAPDGFLLRAEGGGERFTGVVTRGACSDGMSDRSFGWEVLLFRAGAGNRVLRGCCTLDGTR